VLAGFNATDEFAAPHWIEVIGGNSGYAGSFRLNPEYQVLTSRRRSAGYTLAARCMFTTAHSFVPVILPADVPCVLLTCGAESATQSQACSVA